MRRVAPALIAAVLVTGCGYGPGPATRTSGDGASPRTSQAETTPIDPVPTSSAYDLSSCPVADEEFCETAVQAIEALQEHDVEALFALSREDRLVCADLATEYFPGCKTKRVLEGYGLSGANFTVDVVEGRLYLEQLHDVVSNFDPFFSDEFGDGRVQVIGVGTCGPDVPRRRSYHLAWTAAVSEEGAPAERLLASFEFTFRRHWRIALWYLDPLKKWVTEQTEPLQLAFCEAGRSPWPT